MHPVFRIRSSVLILACGLVVAGTVAEAAGVVTILANPGRFGRVEQAAVAEREVDWWDDDLADDNACTESFAATELRRFLAVCTGTKADDIRLAGTDAMPADGDVFLIGSDGSNPLIESRKPAGEKGFAPAAAEGFRVLATRDGGRTITIIKGFDRVGALYGVYAYLEQVGVRFYGLGERDTVLPPGPVALPAKLDLSEKPDYLTRGFHAFEDRGDPAFFLWMARNRLNFWCALSKDHLWLLKKLGMRLIAGGHDVHALCLNPRTYFEAHPEWYGLRGGKRSGNIKGDFGDNYCTSNAEATAELARNVIRQCIDGEWRYADMLNFWMLDNGKWCECEACKAQGTYTDRLLAVTHAVRTAIRKAREDGRLKRNVQLVTLAYHETLPPPSRPLPADFDYDNCFVTYFPIERCYVHSLADPACTEINAALTQNLQGWTTGVGRQYTGSIFIGEYYNVSSFKSLPLLFSRSMAADIPWYYKTGARHFHYMHTPTRLWGTWRLNQYLMARLLWNTKTNADALLAEYFDRLYPSTSARTRTFYRELEYATSNFKAFKHYVHVGGISYSLRSRLTNDKLPLFPFDHLHYEPYAPVLNDGPDVVEIVDGFARARAAMDAALVECGDAAERARLVEDEARFAYGEATARFYYHLIRTAMFHRKGDGQQARREFAAAEDQAAVLRRIVDLVQVSSTHANAKDGLDASQATAAYEYFGKLYRGGEPSR